MIATDSDTIVVRRATPGDTAAIERLAALDSAQAPSGEVIVAEVDGEVRAAMAVADRSFVADPFHRTEGLVELLAVRADRMREGLPRAVRVRTRLELWWNLLHRAATVHPTV